MASSKRSTARGTSSASTSRGPRPTSTSSPTRSTSSTDVPRSVVIALGSNLGDRRYNLLRAVHALSDVVRVVRASSIHETAAVDAPPGSAAFLNMVVAGHTALAPETLLDAMLAIETTLGRRRRGVRNEPRVIDLDLIVYGGERRRTASLTLPHPRAADRAFVMGPMTEIGLSWLRRAATRFIALLSLTTILMAVDVEGQRTPDRYEKALLPLYSTATGVAESRWATRLWMRNEANRTLDVFPMGPFCVTTVSCPRTLKPYPTIGARETALEPAGGTFVSSTLANSDPAAPGIFFYVERDGAGDLSVQLHVADIERRPLARGTSIPVVRESQFFTDETHITGIPLTGETRIALRVYNRESEGGAIVRLRIYDLTDSRLLAEEDVAFVHTAKDSCAPFDLNGCPPGFSYKPGVIQITDLLAHFPALAQSVNRLARLYIELEPVTPGLAFWPMVSVTDNATSEVTIYIAR